MAEEEPFLLKDMKKPWEIIALLQEDPEFWNLSSKTARRQYLKDNWNIKPGRADIIHELLQNKAKEAKRIDSEQQKDLDEITKDFLAASDWKAEDRIFNYVLVNKEIEGKKEEHIFRVWIENNQIRYDIEDSICLPPDTTMSQECFQQILKEKSIPNIEIGYLFEQFKERHSQFVYLDEIYLINGVLKSICSYFPEVFKTVPYTDIFSPEYGSGKTTYMMVCVDSSYHGIVNVEPSGAVLYRNMRDVRCTVGLDEVDRLNPKNDSNIIAIVNSSNIKGVYIARVNMDKDRIDYYDAFGVKYFTRVGNMPNPSWNSRSDPVPMIENKGRKDLKKYPGPNDFKDLRDQAYLSRWTHMEKVQEIYQTLQDEGILKDRNGDIYLPMLTIARLVSDDIFHRVLKHAKDQWLKTSLKSKDINKEMLVRILYENEDLQGVIKVVDIVNPFNERLAELKLLYRTREGKLKKHNSRYIIKLLEQLRFERVPKKTGGNVHFDIKPIILEDNVLIYDITLSEDSEKSEDKKGVGEKKSAHSFSSLIPKKTSLSSLSSLNELTPIDKIGSLLDKWIEESEEGWINIKPTIDCLVQEGFNRKLAKKVIDEGTRSGKYFEPQPGRISKP